MREKNVKQTSLVFSASMTRSIAAWSSKNTMSAYPPSPAQTRRIMALRRRILIGTRASATVLASYTPPTPAVTGPLLQAYLHQRLARISYRDQHSVITHRDIEPQYLYYNLPVWYVLAWDRLRDAVRSFRIDRIESLAVLPTGFRQRRVEAFLHEAEVGVRPI